MLTLRKVSTKTPARRLFHVSIRRPNSTLFDPSKAERAEDDVDVCIVGGGPAGLSAAIRLKQLERERGKEIRVVVLEKGSEIGSHVLAGAVIEPRALNELLPEWRNIPDHPLKQPATSSKMRFLTSKTSFPIPHPPQMANEGNYVLSLSQFTSWLGGIAEDMGVEVYPGFSGADVIYGEKGEVRGVTTNEVGLDRSNRMKENFEPGMNFISKVTLLAEGAHGSLSKSVVKHFDLRRNADLQTYGIGVKEVWRVDPSQHRPGEVIHTVGWPLDWKTFGGGWIYHMADGLISIGLVIGLDYANPYLSPYLEFQRMKHHPYISNLLVNGERLAYGARVLNEGGLQSIPELHFPGGALIGCSAGFVNLPKIKGVHNAMKSGMLAAETAYEIITQRQEGPTDMTEYETKLRQSWIYEELKEVRNLRQSFNTSLGVWGGILYSGVDSYVLKGRVPWTFRNTISDAEHTKRASECTPIKYPPPEPPLSTDLLTSLTLTATNHAEDQPVHLQLPPSSDAHRNHVKINVGEYASLLGHACPAAVYEYVDASENDPEAYQAKKLVINSQNCIHCKLCDIKVPTQDITWTVPEGGGGPKYKLT